jgi:hypothetical protein
MVGLSVDSRGTFTSIECLWDDLVFAAQGNDNAKKKKKYIIGFLGPILSPLSRLLPLSYVYLEYL